jgi:3',5'-nucleoside bisphosphate phosphatase
MATDGRRRSEPRPRLEDGRCDLHAHTVFSDGLFTPEELVAEAKKLNLAAVGITDHDAMGGVERAVAAGRKLGIEVVPGVEMSCNTNGVDVHILGYYVDYGAGAVQEFLGLVREKRRERAEKMVLKLNELGINIRMARVEELAAGAAIGRPHVASALVETGAVVSTDEAFSRYIGYDGPAYYPKMQLSPAEAVEFIHKHGGVAVVAHPATYDSDAALYAMIEAGTDGIEVWHPDHSAKDSDYLLEVSQKNGMVQTGGSDCHGGRKHGKIYLGQVSIPYRYLRALRQRRERWLGTKD